MTITKLFEYIKDVKPHFFSEGALLRWLSECEGMIQTYIHLTSLADVIVYESVRATKSVRVDVTANADSPADRRADSAAITVIDVSGERELDRREITLGLGEAKEFTLIFVSGQGDDSTETSKSVEISRNEVTGAVTLQLDGEEPVTVGPGEDQTVSGLCEITLLVPPPFDRMYYAYLEAMIDFQEGEYNACANTLERYNDEWAEYAAWVGENIKPALGRALDRGYYISAYALAVKHGYEGTEEEWAKLLVDSGNNARLASLSAIAAEGSAEEAAASARAASQSETSAAESALGAASSESAAQSAALEAAGAKASAESSAESAQSHAEDAEYYYGEAASAAGTAQGARDNAISAASAAIDAMNALLNMAVASQTGDPGTAVKVEKIVDPETHAVTLRFSIPRGADGDDGVSPTVTIAEITGGHRITITDAAHPSGQSFDVLDGEDGEDAVSPTVTVTEITGGHRITITDADHPSGQSFDVLDGDAAGGAVKKIILNGEELESDEDGAVEINVDVRTKRAAGAMAVFDGALAGSVPDVLAEVVAVQSGSGDPSPSNVRAISGFSSVTVASSGEDVTSPVEKTVSFGEAAPVYGGVYDAKRGILTVTRVCFSVSALNWTYAANIAGGVFWASTGGTASPTRMKAQGEILSSHYPYVGSYTNIGSGDLKCAYVYDTGIAVKDRAFSGDVEAFKSARANAQFLYELATPVTYELEAAQVAALAGVNKIWADTGDVTVIYDAALSDVIDRVRVGDTVVKGINGEADLTGAVGQIYTVTVRMDATGAITMDQKISEIDAAVKAGKTLAAKVIVPDGSGNCTMCAYEASSGYAYGSFNVWAEYSGGFIEAYSGITDDGDKVSMSINTNPFDIPKELADLSDDSTHRTVTDTEKTTWNAKYTKPSGGIPKSDLAPAVQESLDKADRALQSVTSAAVTAALGYTPAKKKASGTLTLELASWSGSGPWTQVVTLQISGVTTKSKIDLQPDATAIEQMITDGVTALYAAQDNGAVTVYALGAAPTAAITVQYTREEMA